MNAKFLSYALTIIVLSGASSRLAEAATYSNGTATASFNVTLTVQASCAVNASALNFGTASAPSQNITGQTTVGVTCTNTTPYNIGLDEGTVAGSTVTGRLMAGTATGNTSTTVQFQLYQDSGRTVAWGKTQGTDTVSGTGTGVMQNITVYGAVPVQGLPKPDTYKTTITATVFF